MTFTEAEIDAALDVFWKAAQDVKTTSDALVALMQTERDATTKRERERAARIVEDFWLRDPTRQQLAAAIRGEQK